VCVRVCVCVCVCEWAECGSRCRSSTLLNDDQDHILDNRRQNPAPLSVVHPVSMLSFSLSSLFLSSPSVVAHPENTAKQSAYRLSLPTHSLLFLALNRRRPRKQNTAELQWLRFVSRTINQKSRKNTTKRHYKKSTKQGKRTRTKTDIQKKRQQTKKKKAKEQEEEGKEARRKQRKKTAEEQRGRKEGRPPLHSPISRSTCCVLNVP
jgi:hypothetical protein